MEEKIKEDIKELKEDIKGLYRGLTFIYLIVFAFIVFGFGVYFGYTFATW